MKRIIFVLFVFILPLCCMAQKQDTLVTISGMVEIGKPMNLVVERQMGMTQRLANFEVNGEYRVVLSVKEPMIVSLSLGRQFFSSDVFMAPGAEISLDLTREDKFGGTYAGVNNLLLRLSANEYKPKTSGVKAYSKAYAEVVYRCYQEKEACIEASGLSQADKRIVKGYIQLKLLQDMYMIIERSKAFGKAFEAPVVDGDYSDPVLGVDWVSELTFTGDWFPLFQEWLYAQVQNGKIQIASRTTYLNDMASVIKDSKLQEVYLLRAIELELMRGNVKGVKERMKKANHLVKTKTGRDKLAMYAGKLTKSVYPGMEGVDLSKYGFPNEKGDTVYLADFSGKYVFIDLWSTGCNPCVAELTYGKRLEHQLGDVPLAWVAVSLDTRADVWKSFMKQKGMDGVQLLCSRAHKDPFMQQLAVHGIPRFVILDPKGKVWDASSLRPSNPVLGVLLRKELSKN